MKRVFSFLGVLLLTVFLFPVNTFAEDSNLHVNLSNLEYSTDGSSYKSIPEYEKLADFLVDYKANNLSSVYVTDFLFDGVSAVKTPDLDDFIEKDSNDTEIKALDIKVINVNTTGNVELTGELTGAMIGVNTNNISSDINLILNGVKLDTDSKKAPAIFVYNKDKNYTDHKVTIKTASGSENILEGGKLKKVSLLGSDKLDDYKGNYSGDSLDNYNKYSSYYGIYTSEQIENVLFATVQADNEDLQDGDPLYFYKASGAISSDIDLYFEGEGFLKVTSKNKEGIETKGNLTFSGGTGDYEIYSQDDCLNTTTASSSNTTVRNDLTINVNSLLASVSADADEGDAIDSNGKLTINGGTVYAFAHPTSQDAGLDSTGGTYINGGTVIATGNMVDQISNDSKQDFIFASFDQIAADIPVVIKDQNGNIIAAFKSDRTFKTLIYSSADLDYENLKIYKGGEISGSETNGLYSKVDSYTGGEEVVFVNMSSKSETYENDASTVALVALLAEFVLLFIALTVYTKKY